jgi:hypothetical protein
MTLRTRTEREIRELIHDLTCQYLLGAPGTSPWPNLDDEGEAHAMILASIDLVSGYDEDALDEILIRGHIDSPGALRALLRLIGSYAAISALSWILDEELPGVLMDRYAPEHDDVLRDARAVLRDVEPDL